MEENKNQKAAITEKIRYKIDAVGDLNIEFVRDFLRNTNLTLNASQEKVSFPILSRIHRRLKEGKRFSSIQVEGNMIINGHHRFICLSILELKVEQNSWTKNISGTAIIPWPDMIVDENDYDTDEEREEYRNKYDEEKITSGGE
ncbi:MAG: hypothetical protein JWP12_1944 [Bacteroidetes bacterium]|nr:hypothetical protein [Bacteroidota bacterium]